MELTWFLPAIASPIIYGLVTVGDKWILSSLKLRIESFNLFVAAVQMTASIVILLILGIPDAPIGAFIASFAGGALWGLALIIMFWALRREQMGRVVPVAQSSPVFAALLGVFILGEHLEWYGWIAILLVVGGAVLVSAEPKLLLSGGFSKIYLAIMFSAALIGIAQFSLKIATDDLSLWHNMSIRGLGLFATLGLPFIRVSVVRDIGIFLSNRRTAIPLLITEGIATIIGNAFLFLALANGPVSSVSALLGTRPVFVLITTLIFAPFAKRALAEKFSKADIVTKVASTTAVVSGVAIISLA